MAYLILIRHGESEWNKDSKWTGWRDIPLSVKGHQEAKAAAEKLRSIPINRVYVSALTRSRQTWDDIASVLNLTGTEVTPAEALNERNYGDYTGQNKWELKKEFGDEKFNAIHRGWDVPIPHGETLRNVYERVVPYFSQEILPHLRDGENVLISAHGNSLRALVKYLENISDEKISEVQLKTGEIYLYTMSDTGEITEKTIL